VADDLQALVIKIPDAETAIFDIRIITSEWPEGEPPVHRGASAPPAPAMVEFQRGSIASHRIRSRHLGGERMIQVYVPTGLPAGSRLPVIYLGDGLNPDYVRISAAAVRDGRAQPAIIVGIENAGSTQDPSCAPRCDPRSREYLVDMPNATAEESRFENHAAFVIHEVIPLVEANYPAKRGADQRTAMGYSSGGAWALSMATRHPEAFSNAIALSLGWKPAADAARRILPSARLFLGAGRLEARFLSRTLLAAENARAAGAQVQLSTVNAGHSFENWAILFEQALRWLFPPARLG
jgi:enterochelin esterase-like enzyme